MSHIQIAVVEGTLRTMPPDKWGAWVKEKLIGCDNGKYWESMFSQKK